ncbi:Choline kinase [Marinobacter daqiaonensis]|uniref:Choline kinase n=1 Tax=Marinobacter daqiaonensis TaxID=650891 RepID=A0A1I6HA18_9GAMM|nr:PEP/pyruvate-binding domain-containing protein [Marinobacter daqiaonensis]SFR51117.1 Choline kinase [Marinobacter daqiaonensis]
MKSTYSRCVILGAGAPHQGEQPTLLEPVNGISVLNWLLNALAVPESQIDLVLGYQSEHIAERYPDIRRVVNPRWETTGSAGSLLEVDLDDVEDLLVCYGDILFRPQVVEEMKEKEAPIVVAWDSLWKQRYLDRDPRDMEQSEKILGGSPAVHRLGSDIPMDWASGEFIGLVWLTGRAIDHLRLLKTEAPESLRRMHLSGLVEWLRSNGLPVVGYDVSGDWAEVNQERDIAHFVLGTKADTLARLRGMISSAIILDQVSFSISDWKSNASSIMKSVLDKFNGNSVVVRSSARSEDGFNHSNAGAYSSVLNVDIRTGLECAVTEVISSYQNACLEDQVLIQPMLGNVLMSGVAFTRTLERGGPWYVVNYEESGRTDGITGGHSINSRTLYVRRDASMDLVADQRLVTLVRALKEIEQLLAYDALDVEFALDESGQVYILQVRPIAVEHTNVPGLSEVINENLRQAEMRWDSLEPALPQVVGTDPIYGVMPDWNPAEIIGTHPSTLAESLYRYLILDEVWATQRAEFGYRDVRPHPLLVNFAGKPYIDVRASFNSFIPASVPDGLAQRLVTFYLNWLRQHPHLHDKVEFDVVPTCLGLDFAGWRNRLVNEAGLSDTEVDCLETGLRQITANAIERTNADIGGLVRLQSNYTAINERPITCNSALIEKAKILLDDCKMLGTLPFAHLARSAFVAVTLLKEAVKTGIISGSAHDELMTTVRTVSHELNADAQATEKGEMPWEVFVNKYGHLRPGTYDITSPAYRDDPEKYLRPIVYSSSGSERKAKSVGNWQREKAAFFEAIRAKGLDYSDVELERFLFNAIEGREKAKFIFTRNLSRALDLIAKWGEKYSITRDEIANLTLSDLQNICVKSQDNGDYARYLASRSATQRQVSLACELPALICGRQDFYSFLLQAGQPNYIGSKRIVADCINLAQITTDSEQLQVEGRIVLIPQADPGYDWLFGQDIAGLVTMYGGANSHMAIRTAEFGLPAAIGIGEHLYRQLAKANVLELDPPNRQLKILY